MVLPAVLPDWLPWWLVLPVVVIVIFFLLAFLAMPFSVFGVKSRLESLEERLDEIQGEIRSLSLRLPEPGEPPVYYEERPERVPARDAVPARDVTPARRPPVNTLRPRPPIPPAARDQDIVDEPPARLGNAPVRRPASSSQPPEPRRTEPRLDWPR